MYALHGTESIRPLDFPDRPYVTCVDGYAWSGSAGSGAVCLEPGKPPVLCPAELVSRAIDGEPLDRALACAEIVSSYGEHTLRILFPPRCRRCGRDHWSTDGKRLWHSGEAVHPEAVELLRAARLPLRAFRVPDVAEEKKRGRSGGRGARGGRSGAYLGLPIRSSPEATLAAQVAYAIARGAPDVRERILRESKAVRAEMREQIDACERLTAEDWATVVR